MGRDAREVLVIAGVAGCGKSTVAAKLAAQLGWSFIEGDDHHDAESKERMRDGIGLTDAERVPWLARIADEVHRQGSSVVACSALARRHRDALRSRVDGLIFVQLSMPVSEAMRRVDARAGHFAGSSLLASQFHDLEPLGKDEAGSVIDAKGTIDAIVAQVVASHVASADRLAR